VDAAAQKAPVTIGTLPAPKQATAAAVATLKAVTDSTEVKIPVATETVSASAPKAAIVTTTVVPRAPAASQVVAPPTISSIAEAPVPVIAAPVKVVSAAARSTGATSAQVLTQVKPVYPMAAKIMHAQGSATLKVKIAKDGSVSDVQWVNGNSVFKDAALTAVRQWKYKPATLNGEPAEATQEVTLKFLPQ
jgi:protein TonB